MKEKTISLKIFAFLMSLLILLVSLPSYAFATLITEGSEASLEESYEKKDVIVLEEDESLREENIKHYKLSDGTTKAVVYSQAVHYLDENGAWIDIDNALTLNGSEYTTNNKTKIKFANKSDSNGLVSIRNGKYKIDFTPLNTNKVSVEIENPQKAGSRKFEDVSALNNLISKATYSGVYDGVDLEYILIGNKIKENIVVNQKGDSYTFSFEINLNKLKAELESNSIILCDYDTGAEIYKIPAPYMQDASGEYSNDVSYSLTQDSKWKYTLTVTANPNWINSEERAFPVRIDPTVQTGTPVIDTYTSAENNSSNFESGALLLGNSFGYYDSRIFVKISTLPQIPQGTKLVDAKLSMQVYVLDAFKVGVFRAKENWTTGVTYSNASSYISENLPADIIRLSENGRALWNITKIYEQWITGTANYGVCLKGIGITETTSAGAVVQACESTNYYVPNIEVTYVSTTGLEDYYSYHTSSAGSAGVGYVNGFTGNLTFVHSLTTTADEIMPFSLATIYNSNLGTWNLNVYESIVPQTIDGYQHFKWTDADGTEHWFAPILKRNLPGMLSAFQYDENGNEVPVNTPTEFYDQDGLGLTLTHSDYAVFTISDDKGNSKTIVDGLVVQTMDKYGNKRQVYQSSDEGLNVELLPNGETVPIAQLHIETYENRYEVWNLQTDENVRVYESNGLISKIEHYQDTQKFASGLLYYSSGKLILAYDEIATQGIEYAYSENKVERVSEFAQEGSTSTYGNTVLISYSNLTTTYRTAGADNDFYTSDDMLSKYVYDISGKIVTAYTHDTKGNILGASNYEYNNMYADDSVGVKQNNTLSSVSTVGANPVNLLINPDCEATLWWTASGLTNQVVPTPRYEYGFTSGDVFKLTTPTTGTLKQEITLAPGKYTFSMSVFRSLSTSSQFSLCVYDSSNNVVKSTDNLFVSSIDNGKWTRENLTFEIGTRGTYYVGVNLCVSSSTSYVYVDNAMLEVGEGASAFSSYGDGARSNSSRNSTMTNASTGTGMNNTQGVVLSSNLTKLARCVTTLELDSKQKLQTIAVSAWTKATSAVPSSNTANSTSRYCIVVVVTFSGKNNDETAYTNKGSRGYTINANPLIADWQYLCEVIQIEQDADFYAYDEKKITLEVHLQYSGNVGSACFDNVSVLQGGTQTSYDYNEMGYISSVTDQNGNKINYEYASNNVDLIKATDSQGRTQEYAYGSNHILSSSTYSGKASLEEQYHRNNFGQLLGVSKGENPFEGAISVSNYYNDKSKAYFSKPKEVMDQNQRVTYYTYDDCGRVLSIAEGGHVDESEYNAIKYVYNSYGELIGALPATYKPSTDTLTVLSTETKRVDYIYNNKHILSQIISPSTEYNMVYNKFNAIEQILIGNTAIATYEYVQNNGNLKKTTLGNGAYIEYTYDSVDRLVGVCYNGIEEARFVYSLSGNLSSVVDVDNDTSYSYYYNGAGNLISERVSGANGILFQKNYEYDEYNRLSKRHVIYVDADYSRQHTEEYYYNKDGNVERIVRGIRNECGLEYTYDSFGRLSTQVKKGSSFLTTQYEYANLNTYFSTIITKTTTNGEITSYGYDNVGNIESITLPTGEKITYTYDNTSQLIREDNEPLGVSYKYNYDSAGNLTSVEEYTHTEKSIALSGTPTNTHTYSYENSEWGDQLTKYNGVSLTYDRIGNPLTYYNGTSYTFTWDEGRQLSSATLSGSTITYKYNQDGIRVEKVANGVKHTYYLNGTQIEREVQSDATTGDLIIDLRYYYDIMGIASHIEVYGSTGTRTKFTLETNIQGDVVAIYTDALTKVASYRYDAWGNCTVLNANGQETTSESFIGNLNPFRYRGYYYDTETGFYYLNSRYYDPQVKRFINADEYAATGQGFTGNNMFAYCGNNPVMFIDKNGNLISHPAVLGGAIAAGLIVAALLCLAITIYPSNDRTDDSFGTGFGNDATIRFPTFEIPKAEEAPRVESPSIAVPEVETDKDNKYRTYYHVTTKSAAEMIIKSGMLIGDIWEGGYVFVWGLKPNAFAIKNAGIGKKGQVIIAFETDAAFENDPGIKNPEIIFYQPLRSVFPGPVIIKNVRVVN